MEYVPSTKQVERQFAQYLDKASKDILIESSIDPFRLYFLRPSSFPYCGLQFFLSFPEKLKAGTRSEGLATGYFTSVGHATHNVFQRYTAKLGKIIANWKCTNKRCSEYDKLIKFAPYKNCVKCGREVTHKELALKYKKTLLGHTDALFRFSPNLGNKSLHFVGDYKTTSSRNVKADEEAAMKGNKRTFPYKSNVAQIQTYIPLLEDNYGISVDYWVLVYLARDAPFQYGRRIVVHYVNAKAKEKLRKGLDKTVKIHRKVLKAVDEEDLQVIRKHKLCKSLEDYKKNYQDEHSECPYLDVCFKDKEMTAKIRETLKANKKVWPIIKNAPDKVREQMEL